MDEHAKAKSGSDGAPQLKHGPGTLDARAPTTDQAAGPGDSRDSPKRHGDKLDHAAKEAAKRG